MRVDALKGSYGVQHRRDKKQGSLFWFEIPYRPDFESANLLQQPCSNQLQEMQPLNKVESQKHSPAQSIAIVPPRHLSRNKLFPLIESSRENLIGSSTITNTPCNDSPIMSIPSSIQPLSTDTIDDKLRILIADDSPTIMKMISMMLKMKGHQVTAAENGSIALQVLEQQWKSQGKGFDVILMDLQMPVMDGLEATRRIRYLEQSEDKGSVYYAHHQLIIGMSANSDHETMEASYFAGMDDFIVKPFHMDVFLLKLKQVMSASSVEHSKNVS
jgi:CheY-like chemotaxis protein